MIIKLAVKCTVQILSMVFIPNNTNYQSKSKKVTKKIDSPGHVPGTPFVWMIPKGKQNV